jgi:hypothetical protein
MDSKAYFRALEANLTRSARVCDFALGVTCSLLAVLLIVFATQTRTLRDVRRVQTPSSPIRVVVLANATLLASFLAAVLDLFLSQARREFPPWGDSLGIPLFQFVVTAAVLIPGVNLALAPFLFRKTLPVSLWLRPHGARAWVLSIVAGSVALGGLVLALSAVASGSFLGVVPLMFVTYVALCARAAAAAPSLAGEETVLR